jgi:hypothetical protein
MKILIGECHVYISELLNAARITLGDGVIRIISNKPVIFGNCHSVNHVISKDLITSSLGITCDSDIEIYVAHSSLFNKPALSSCDPWKICTPLPFRNIRFDIAVIPHEHDYKVDAKNIITFDHEYYCGNLYFLYINNKSAYSKNVMDNEFKNKFLEELRKLAQEPQIEDYCLIKEMEKLKRRIVELESYIAK